MFYQRVPFTLPCFADLTELLFAEKGSHPQTVTVCSYSVSSAHPSTDDEGVYRCLSKLLSKNPCDGLGSIDYQDIIKQRRKVKLVFTSK